MEQAFITGADRGVGFALCEQFAMHGYQVLAGQYMPEWKALEGLREKYPDQVTCITLDVGNTESVKDAVRRTADICGKVDILVNCAGIIRDDTRPVFVAAGEDEKILGYAFCILQQHIGDNILTDIKTLYIDDLCVDENERGRHIGRRLYDFVVVYAKKAGCYNVTLNVWACNEGAMKFYERCGLKMQKMGMEIIL